METFDNLAHQIVLLAIDPSGGGVRKRRRLGEATAAGALAELALQERLAISAAGIQLRDDRPTDDPMVDVMLRDLVNRPGRSAGRIIGDAKDAYLNQALGELVSNRWVRLTPASGLRGDSYQVTDGARLAAATDLAASALSAPAAATDRAALLAGLLVQTGLARALLLDPAERSAARQQFERRSWANPAVKAVFDDCVQLDRI